jgi:hypothetical protein
MSNYWLYFRGAGHISRLVNATEPFISPISISISKGSLDTSSRDFLIHILKCQLNVRYLDKDIINTKRNPPQ